MYRLESSPSLRTDLGKIFTATNPKRTKNPAGNQIFTKFTDLDITGSVLEASKIRTSTASC